MEMSRRALDVQLWSSEERSMVFGDSQERTDREENQGVSLGYSGIKWLQRKKEEPSKKVPGSRRERNKRVWSSRSQVKKFMQERGAHPICTRHVIGQAEWGLRVCRWIWQHGGPCWFS